MGQARTAERQAAGSKTQFAGACHAKKRPRAWVDGTPQSTGIVPERLYIPCRREGAQAQRNSTRVLRDASKPKDNPPGDIDGALHCEKPCVEGPGIDNNDRGLRVPKGKGKLRDPIAEKAVEALAEARETALPVGLPLGLHKLQDGIHISRHEGPHSNILLNIARHQHRKREGPGQEENPRPHPQAAVVRVKAAPRCVREWHSAKAFRACPPYHAGAAEHQQGVGRWPMAQQGAWHRGCSVLGFNQAGPALRCFCAGCLVLGLPLGATHFPGLATRMTPGLSGTSSCDGGHRFTRRS